MISFALALSGAAMAQVVVPAAWTNTEAPSDNRFPFFAGGQTQMRYQQVYGASEFGVGPLVLSGMQFRLDTDDASFLNQAANVVVNLSTTSRAPDGLSNVFADNLGADLMTVASGVLMLSGTGGVGPNPFDVSIVFSTNFVYNPGAGNLLLEVYRFGGSDNEYYFDGLNQTGDSVSRLFLNGSTTAPSGNTDSFGLVTRFTANPVPEPATMTVLGFAALVALRRRNKR